MKHRNFPSKHVKEVQTVLLVHFSFPQSLLTNFNMTAKTTFWLRLLKRLSSGHFKQKIERMYDKARYNSNCGNALFKFTSLTYNDL